MSDESEKRSVVETECPCCGARLLIDAGKGVVLEGRDAAGVRKGIDLKDAGKVLQEESARIHERYRRIVEADKGRGASMEAKFKDFMEKAKDEPPPKPVRDIDLD